MKRFLTPLIILLTLLPLTVFAAAFPYGVGGTGTTTPNISQLVWWGINNLKGIATTSVSCSGSVSCTSFTALGPSPITIHSSGGGSGTVSTSSSETAGYIPFWTTTSATPAKLSGGLSSFTFNSSGNRFTVTNASTTNFSTSYASSTSYYGAGLSTCNGASSALTWAVGKYGCHIISGGTGTFPFTKTSYGVSTSTTVGFLNGLLSTASTTISGALHLIATTTSANGFNITNGCYSISGVCQTPSVAIATETPSGTINGTNTSFTVTHTPFQIDVNGAIQIPPSDYTISGNTVTFSNAPSTGSNLLSYYAKAGSGGGGGGTVTSIIAGLGLNGGTITTTGTISLKSYLATSTGETKGYLPYWTSTNGTPATLGKVATTSLSVSGPLSLTGTLGSLVGGSNSTISIPQANGSTNGYLGSSDWTNFNTAYTDRITSTSFPLQIASNILSWIGLATSTNLTRGDLLYATGPKNIGQVATSTLTASSPLTGSFTVVGSGGSVGCQTASGSQAGCLSSTDWSTFNGKQAALSTPTWPIILSGTTLSFGGLSTTTNFSTKGQLPYITGVHSFGTVATSSETCTTASGISCTAFNHIGSGGAISLSAIPNSSLSNSTISGISLGSNLNSLSMNSSLTGTSYNGSAAVSNWGLNLGNANTWTALQTFANATTTKLSATYASSTKAYFGTLNLPNLTSTQCLHEVSGVVSGTGSDCGSGSGAVTSVSNSDGTLTISPTTGAVVASLALGHANSWTALQTFGKGLISQASSTVEGSLVIATTSPGSDIVDVKNGATTYFSINSSGALNGYQQIQFNGPSYSQFQDTTANAGMDFKTVAGTGDITFTPNAVTLLTASHNNNIGISTSTPYRKLSVEGSGVFTGGNVLASTFTATSSITDNGLTSGDCVEASTAGLLTTTGSACGGSGSTPGGSEGQIQYNHSSAFTGAGNLYYINSDGFFGIGTSSPNTLFSIGSSTPVLTAEFRFGHNAPATSTAMYIGMASSSNQEIGMGTGATTLHISPYHLYAGETIRVMTCNGTGGGNASDAWANLHYSGGGGSPGFTTAANQCDMWFITAEQATSSVIAILTGMTPGIQ